MPMPHTHRCTFCGDSGLITGGERGETNEPCPYCRPDDAAAFEARQRAVKRTGAFISHEDACHLQQVWVMIRGSKTERDARITQWLATIVDATKP